MRASLLIFTVYHSAEGYVQPRRQQRPLSRLALTPLERAIAGNDVDAVVDTLDDASVPCDRALAIAALDKAAAVTPDSSDGEQFAAAFEEARLVRMKAEILTFQRTSIRAHSATVLRVVTM